MSENKARDKERDKRSSKERGGDSQRERRRSDRSDRDRTDRSYRNKKDDDRSDRRGDRDRDRKRYDDSSRRHRDDRSRSYDRHKSDRHRSDTRDRRDKERDRDRRDPRDSRDDDRKRSNRSRDRDRKRRSYTKSKSKSPDRSSKSSRRHSKDNSTRKSIDVEMENPTNTNNVRIIPLSPSNHRTRSSKVAEQMLLQQQYHLETQQNNEKIEMEYFINKSIKEDETIEIKGEITEEERNAIQEKLKERLRQHLESEGKVYPPPKPKTKQTQAGFINDGSFLERFKQMQEHMSLQPAQPQLLSQPQYSHAASQDVRYEDNSRTKPAVPQFGRRRGGKILKTGIVKKTINMDEIGSDSLKEPWAIYLQEVKKYKKASCDAGETTRSLVK